MRFANHSQTIFTTLAICFAMTAAIQGAEKVQVVTDNGKKYFAELDDRTSKEYLWLRFGRGSTVIRRRIQWDSIVEARVRDALVSASQLQEMATNMDRDAPERDAEPPAVQRASPLSDAERAVQWLGFAPRVHQFQFDAFLGNWDGDAEPDGFQMLVIPSDDFGYLVPVDGYLDVEVIADRYIPFHHAPHGRGFQPTSITRKRFAIRAEQFTTEGIALRVAFPESLIREIENWDYTATIQAKLVVPGHGVIERELAGIRLHW